MKKHDAAKYLCIYYILFVNKHYNITSVEPYVNSAILFSKNNRPIILYSYVHSVHVN